MRAPRLSSADASPSGTRRFAAAVSGAAAVEFAIVVMPFLAMLLGGLQMGMNYMFISQLDYATGRAAQMIRTGQVKIQETSAENFIATMLCPHLAGVSCQSILVNAQIVKTEADWPLNPAFVANPSAARWCPGAGGELVLLQAALKLPPMFVDFYGSATQAGSNLYYVASTAFRNDPTGGWSAAC